MSTGVPTSILGLHVFKTSDAMLYDEVNDNSTQLDTLPPTVCTSADRPTANLYQGRLIWESDTKRLYMYDLSTTAWKLVSDVSKDTGWLTITPASGWSHASGSTAQARQIGQIIYLRGGLVNATFTGGYTTCGTLPAAIDAIGTACAVPVSSNTNVARSINFNTDKTLSAYAASASGAAFFIGGGYAV